MDKKTKKALLNKIEKLSDENLIETLAFLREKGDEDFIIPLARILVTTKNEIIKKEIKNIFLEIKRSKASREIIKILKDKYFEHEKKFFSSLCWELNLDFSPYLEDLLNFYIEYNDLEQALNMFSAIEVTLSSYSTKFSKEELEKLQKKLKDAIPNFEHSKKLLSVKLSSLFDKAMKNSMLGNINELNL